MHEHLQQLLNAEGSIEKLTSKADENYFRSMSDIARGDIRDLELNMNNSDTAKVRRMKENKRASRMERGEINSFCKVDNTVSKSRKRKGKLRSSASKSTVTTKDTYFVRRKEAKRRRHRGTSLHNLNNSHDKTLSNLLRIFFNTNV